MPPHNSQKVQMKAIIATGYGSADVLKLVEIDKPLPKCDEVLVKIQVTNVTAADTMMRRGVPRCLRPLLGTTKPRNPVPGTGLSGSVEAVGSAVTRFQVGDEVYGEAGVKFGAHAEYVCVAEDGAINKKPAPLSFQDAAVMCDGPLTSLNFLKRMAKVEAGQKVLINGASGSLGSAAVQLALAFGAQVTAVCSTANVELVKALGAHEVIDYTKEDFTTNVGTYDVIYDTVGTSSYGRAKRALTRQGKYLSPVLTMKLLFCMLCTSLFGKKKAMFDATGLRPAVQLRAFLAELEELVEDGKLRLITERSFPLEQIAEAHKHVDSGRKKGNVIVCLASA
ncbi:MAG: NADPH:quinone reductase-like Zn-dependent oxidoreductase [Planctomycetota bacterium]|jgi:NADPH:quinone reductase-like Zn-dependent oxidoreductase